ncbi:MAG: aldo/keto reductase [Clostridia bacterium]|nr:aldo/keto reductase [Clostridia bacterium]
MAFEKIKGNFGFGCMRLPMNDTEVDTAHFSEMIDLFMASGFNYFDTAHGYIEGKSETALRDCLIGRYDREDYVLTDKLSYWYIKGEDDILPLFHKQLERVGVEYFDFYLLHALNRERYECFKRWNAPEIIKKLRDEGYIRHIGMSFHDTAEVLDMILTEQPDIEVVQLQINYLDFDDPGVQSKACYDVAVKHGKKVIVMEPVKGGVLADPPGEVKTLLDGIGVQSYASFAIRYAASFPEVFMVLSGMGNMKMVEDNVRAMRDFSPLTEDERHTADEARVLIRKHNQIPCTACNYCAEVCPKKIPISRTFRAMNEVALARLTRAEAKDTLPKEGASAKDCIGCARCESVCPQGIAIREKLETAAKMFKQ